MVRSLANLVGSVTSRKRNDEPAPEGRDRCIVCDFELKSDDVYHDFRVCSRCRFHYSMSARERIESLVDPNSFGETSGSLISLDPLSFASANSYSSSIFQDQRRTGLTEAVLTGAASIAGSPVMLIVLDFGFMGGTMGCAVGEKVTLALERAAKRGLPAVAIVTSGGARIQEGVLSLMQMAKTTAAANRLNEAGLPFITVLANPATGQAYGSFANLADIILAEPGAIVGFSSLRVIERASDRPLPSGSHTAESHMAHGMLDAVVQRTELRTIIGVLLDLLGTGFHLENDDGRQRKFPSIHPSQAWESVQMARHHSRPSSADYLSRLFSEFVELHGDRAYGEDPSVISGLGRIAGQTVAVVAQQRVADQPDDETAHQSPTAPEGFRKAQRTMDLARKFSLPIITFVDTSGPDLSEAAEQRGLGNTIANTMSIMAGLPVPTISIVIGQAGSGGALALGMADRALMLEHSIYTAVSPEEAAEVMFQDPSKVKEVASSMRMTATDCLDLGIIDRIVPEPRNGAHSDPDEAARMLHRVLVVELAGLQSKSAKKRAKERYAKYRNMGEYSSQVKATIAKEVNAFQNLVKSGMTRILHRKSSEPTLEDHTGGNGYLYGSDDD